LALAALALQMSLAFSHVHLNGSHHFVNTQRSSVAASPHGPLAQASPQTPTPNPVNDDDYCAICASIFLVSTLFTSQPSALQVPVGFERIQHSINNAQVLTKSPRLAFRSRAPPAA
jgi:hypothetical protein